METSRHVSVLVKEVVELLACRPDRVYVDGTVGSGGHSRAILEATSPTGRLIGLDWDAKAIARARENLSPFGGRVKLVAANFKELAAVLHSLNIPGGDGILLDLGISTEHLDDPERGFSFRWDAPLDMRMSQEGELTAQDLLDRLSAAELNDILWKYGEERWAKRIARRIVEQRRLRPIRSTRQLAGIVERAVPYRGGRIHPATRTFQALRIAVNRELENLEIFLAGAPCLLNPGGRLGIISFHSLEDRIVKENFRKWAREAEGGHSFRLITKKPVVPGAAEVAANPRARSAKLRVVERIT